MNLLALFISRLFEPMVVVVFLALLAGWRANLAGADRRLYALYLSAQVVLIGLIWVAARRRLKTDWDISERKKRIRPLLILLLIVLGNWFVVRIWHNGELLNFFYLFALWLLGFFFITLRYKISGHVGVVTLAAGLVVTWFGRAWLPVFLTVPLVAWARVRLGKHTVGEVIAGVVYSWGLVWLWCWR